MEISARKRGGHGEKLNGEKFQLFVFELKKQIETNKNLNQVFVASNRKFGLTPGC